MCCIIMFYSSAYSTKVSRFRLATVTTMSVISPEIKERDKKKIVTKSWDTEQNMKIFLAIRREIQKIKKRRGKCAYVKNIERKWEKEGK